MIKFDLGTRFADVINLETIEKWFGNVILEGGTGTGKTYFIIRVLGRYCILNRKKILFLCNRIALFDEVSALVKRLGLSDTIEVKTYQNIEWASRFDKSLLPDTKYDYIACDEFHHVNEIYNPYTDLSYDWIIKQPAIKIFMSATCTQLFNSFVEDLTVPISQRYYIPKDYSYVDELVLFYKKKHIDKLIDDILKNTNDKVIFFSNSTSRAIDTHMKYKEHSSFICSPHSKEGKRFITKDCIQNETFNSRLLVATKALDVGITLRDKTIKHIITDIFDCDSLVQCIGRKRVTDESDTCKFYIMNHSASSLRGQKSIINADLKPIRLLATDPESFNKQYANDREFHSKYIYHDNTYNKIAYRRLQILARDIDIMEGWKKVDDDFNKHIYGKGYKYFLLDKLGDTIKVITDMKEVDEGKKMNKLDEYLDSISKTKLFKEEQKEIIHKIDVRINGRQQRSYSKLNEGLKMLNLNYIIIPKKSNDKRYWIVEKMDI